MPTPDGGPEDENGIALTPNDTEPALTIPTAIRPPFIHTGDCELQEEGGTVTIFDAGFLMVRTDGTYYHTIKSHNFPVIIWRASHARANHGADKWNYRCFGKSNYSARIRKYNYNPWRTRFGDPLCRRRYARALQRAAYIWDY